MTNLFQQPDVLPLREALRGLRFLLRRGGETLAETLSVENLPGPAGDLAEIAEKASELASDVVRSVLPQLPPSPEPLDHLSQTQFGAAIYVALRTVLKRLGAPGVLVSETSARAAWQTDPARLALSLVEHRVIRGLLAHEAEQVPGGALESVAIFAVLLWLQAARSDAENEAVLDAATDLALAKAPEIAAAMASADLTRIEALFARLVPHV
ncbi:MAG: hypothetical protein RIS85_106 [Pseudomonadota bacterium]|jgi:hypothetical protein